MPSSNQEYAPTSPAGREGSANVACQFIGQNGLSTGIRPAPHFDCNGKELIRSTCKARGVAADHNPETAYILVPQDADHGQIVICSHPKCNQTGRAFRFCLVCRNVVTKRNFHRRHDHGLLKYSKSGRAILPSDKNQPLIHAGRSRKFEELTANSSSKDGKRHQSCSQAASKHEKLETYPISSIEATNNQHTAARVHLVPKEDEDNNLTKKHRGRSRLLAQAEQDWLKVFRERPPASDDPAATSKWVSLIVDALYPMEALEGKSYQDSSEDDDKANISDDFIDPADLEAISFP